MGSQSWLTVEGLEVPVESWGGQSLRKDPGGDAEGSLTGAAGDIPCDPQNGENCPPSFVFLLALCGWFSREIFGILSQTSYEMKL